VMQQALVVFAGLAAVMVPVQLLVGPPRVALVPLLFSLVCGLGVVLVRAGRQALAAWFLLSVWMVVATLTIGFSGSLPGPTGLYLVPGVMASVLWLRPPGALVMVTLNLAVLALAGPLRQLFAIHVTFDEASLHASMTTSAILSVAIASMLVGTVVQVLARVHSDAQVRALEASAAAAHARKASEAKAAFLATMSHELRTPLNAILGYTEMLREDHPREDEDLARMHAAGSELLTLVDGVLEVARSEASPSAEDPAEVDLVAVIKAAKASVSRYAPQFELKVAAPAERVLVRTHEHQLKRVITQLLVHSAHSLSGGRIEVTVGIVDDGVQIAFPARSETGLAIAVAQRLAESIGGIVTAPTSPPATVGILTLFLDVEVIA
ncbi:MAG: HAMP domain-containing sensor histidine kinase, partial [Myxococcota bacterium]